MNTTSQQSNSVKPMANRLSAASNKRSFTALAVAAALSFGAYGTQALANGKDTKPEKDVRISVTLGHPGHYGPAVRYSNVPPGHYHRGHRYDHPRYGHSRHYDNYPVHSAPARYWVPAHQVWRAGAWLTVPGFYSASYVEPIPPEVYEVQPRHVYPGWLWVRGHWHWNGGNWQWARGIWVRI
jgi:hypothetical protein